MERISVEEFRTRLQAQGVPRIHLAFKCVRCNTIQSMYSMLVAGIGLDVEKYIGFSCIGRWTNAGPHIDGTPPGKGCDWTLGGLFAFRNLEIITPEGDIRPHFELASPDEARAFMNSFFTPPEKAL